jgi:hypothetical protein
MSEHTVKAQLATRATLLTLYSFLICLGCTNTQTTAATNTHSKMHAIILPAPSDSELATLQGGRKDEPLRVGVGRQVPVSESRVALNSLSWRQDPSGSYKAEISVQSIGARAIRVGLRLSVDVPSLDLSFGGSSAILHGSAIVSASDKDIYWSPVLDGDTVLIELTTRAPPKSGAVLEVPVVSHIP